MAWLYAEEHLRASSVTAWREVMQTLDAYTREVNGLLDRDNLPAEVATRAKIEANAFNSVDVIGFNSGVRVAAGARGAWTEIPTSVRDVEVGDGALEIDAWVQAYSDPTSAEVANQEYLMVRDNTEMRVLVDGRVVAETGWCVMSRYARPLAVVGGTPVGAGTVRISMEVRAYGWYTSSVWVDYGFLGGAYATPTVESFLTQNTIDFPRGGIVYRHIAR